MNVTLKKLIKPGFRRPFTITPDEPVDAVATGGFTVPSVLTGDSSAPTINPESTETEISGFINGDGSLGEKTVSLHFDGHVGEGEVGLDVTISYTVGHPDATEFVFKEGTTDEQIPT
jgi:hypothetical protein